jgi:hypothetical protein
MIPQTEKGMKAYRLLLESAPTQEAQLVAFAAFDAAWSEIESQYPPSGPEWEEARYRLASAMLPFLNDEVLNPLWLKDVALKAIRQMP